MVLEKKKYKKSKKRFHIFVILLILIIIVLFFVQIFTLLYIENLKEDMSKIKIQDYTIYTDEHNDTFLKAEFKNVGGIEIKRAKISGIVEHTYRYCSSNFTKLYVKEVRNVELDETFYLKWKISCTSINEDWIDSLKIKYYT